MVKEVTVTDASLLGIECLADLPSTVRAWLIQHAHGRRYAGGESILHCGEYSRDVYFVASGVVRVLYYSSVGREVVYRDMPAGTMFGELSALDGHPRSADVHALDETFVVVMGHEAFMSLLARETGFASHVLQRTASRVRELSERVVEFSTLNVDARVRMELLRHLRTDPAVPRGGRLQPMPTHQDIANRIGTHREAVTRALSQLKRAGLIQRVGTALLIPDIERLRAASVDVSDCR